MTLDRLREKYAWPERKPQRTFDDHGWFGWCHKALLDVVLSEDVSIIVELGSWLGKSTRFLASKAVRSTVIAIDHWQGDDSIRSSNDKDAINKLPLLYEQFLANCWPYRQRIIPVRSGTIDGIHEASSMGIVPDFAYVDACHSYEEAQRDIREVISAWPECRIAGDDYGGRWQGVKSAVDEAARHHGRAIVTADHAWAMVSEEKREAFQARIEERAKIRKHEHYEVLRRGN